MPKRGQPLKPFPGLDTINAELWAGKTGLHAVRGKLSVADVSRVVLFAVAPFDHSGNVTKALLTFPGIRIEGDPHNMLEWFARIYRKNPDDCLRVMQAVTNHMRKRTAVQKAVAADTTSTNEEIANRINAQTKQSVTGDGPKKARQKLRAGWGNISAAEADE